MATIATFVNATTAPYVAGNLNPKRQRLMLLLAKAANTNLLTGGVQDYVSSTTRAAALIADAATATRGITKDQVVAARIVSVYGALGGSVVQAFPNAIKAAVADNMALITPWMELDEAALDRMELLVEYFGTGQA